MEELNDSCETTEIKIHATDTVSGNVFDGVYVVPKSVSDKVSTFGEDIVNFIFESRIRSALGHKCRVYLQNGDTPAQIQEAILEWRPTLRTIGRITVRKIKAEKDPVKKQEMIQKKISELQALGDL